MSLEKSLSQQFSSILQCVDARNDYTGLVIATVVIRVYDAHGALVSHQTAQLLIQCRLGFKTCLSKTKTKTKTQKFQDRPAKQSNLVKKTQHKGYYAVQGHSRSSRSVSIESPYATFYHN